MKIIGSTKEGYLLDATKSELARLVGYYSEYSENKPKLEPGAEININAMCLKLYEFSQWEARLSAIRDALKHMQSGLDIVMPVTPLTTMS